jgi:hypothetical protein
MSFAPWREDDEDEARPRRVGRRAARRRYAIVGALAEHGRMSGLGLCLTLHLPSGTIWPDLAALEGDGRIVGEWVAPLAPLLPPRRLYRLPTDDERRAHRKRARALKLAAERPERHGDGLGGVPRPGIATT